MVTHLQGLAAAILDHLLGIISVLNVLLAITVIFLERRNVGVTWAWLMILLFLPVVGFIIYMFFGQNLSRRKLYKLGAREQMVIRTVVNSQLEDLQDNVFPFSDPASGEYQDMMIMNLQSGRALYTQENEVSIFTDGTAKFDTLLEDIRHARKHIHLIYYIVHHDRIGKRLVEALAAKAREGVEVRFLYDDIGSSKLSSDFFHPLREAGGSAVAFFPSRIPYLNIRVNYRNHRKLAIIDGAVGYIGGYNVGDEYLGLDPRFGPWRDTHLRIRGSAALMMNSQFLLDWNLSSPVKLVPDTSYLPDSLPESQVGVQILSSGPHDSMEQIRNAYIKMIHKARKSVWIQTPYLIPDESLLNALQLAALSGVDVRIMIPKTPDHKMVYWATYSYLGDLLPYGVKCFLYGKGFLHAKTIVVDGMVSSVGTANFDIRSFKLNFEVNAFVYDTGVGTRLHDIFEKDLLQCDELTREEYDRRPTLHKMRESFVRLMSPIL
jgi:cardiolipin synthase A/B